MNSFEEVRGRVFVKVFVVFILKFYCNFLKDPSNYFLKIKNNLKTQRFKGGRKKRSPSLIRVKAQRFGLCAWGVRTENWVSPFRPIGQTDKKIPSTQFPVPPPVLGKWSVVSEALIFSLGGLLFCFEIQSSQQSLDYRYAPILIFLSMLIHMFRRYFFPIFRWLFAEIEGFELGESSGDQERMWVRRKWVG